MMSQELWKNKEQPQRTLAPLSVPGASSAGSIRVVSGSGFRYVVPFPYRLHEMLSSVDEKFDSSIVSWLPDGKHFKVHDPRRFVESVIPSAFKQKSLKSFQRQLHLYGFQRVHEGVDKGAYYHEKFLRHDRDLCLSITRTKAPKRSRVAAAVQKKTFAPKVSTFPPLAKNTQAKFVNTANSLSNNNNMTAASVSPTMFEDNSPHARFIPESSISMKGPLHSSVSVDSSSTSSATDSQSSSSMPQQQQLNLPQQLEGSIAETCRWLINAGVPTSAFDPVPIEDISHTSFSVPQIVPSTAPLNAAIPQQQSTIIESDSKSCSPLNLNPVPVLDNSTNNNEIAMNSLLATPGQSTDNFDPLRAFDDDPLLNAFLPGENLSMVDDSLWAL